MSGSYLIGIAGPSGAGKTCLAQHLARELNALVLATDSYYHDLAHLPLHERARANFDDPVAIDESLLIAHVSQLANGEAVQIPRYDFSTHTRLAETQRFGPAEIVIVEGLFTFHWPKLRDLLHTKVYVEMTDGLCLERRMTRDVRERGRTSESVNEQYRTSVAPMAHRYVYPMKKHANVIVWGEGSLEEHIARVREHMGSAFLERSRK